MASIEFQDCKCVIGKLVVDRRFVPQNTGNLVWSAEQIDCPIYEVAAQLEHHAAPKSCQLLTVCRT